MPTFRAPRGTRDLLPDERAVFARLEPIGTGLATRYGYRPIETPLFEQAAVFERGHRRGHRRRREGAVPDRAADRGGRGVGAPPGADRRDRPRLHPARDADAAAAREADDDRADVPLRPAPGGPLPPVLAVRRRGDRRPGAGRRRRDHRARRTGSTREAGVATSRCRSTRSATRPAGRRTSPSSTAYYRGHADELPADRAGPPRAQRPPAAGLQGPGDGRASTRRAPRITDRLCEACAAHFARVKAHLEALGDPVPRRAGPRPRPRLLHADRVRVLRRGPRGPAAGAGRRRPLRRARRAARRQADARDRVRAGPRPGRAGARGAGASRRRPTRAAGGRRRARIRTTRSERLRVATDLRAARAAGPGGPRRGASSAASSRPRARTARTSR